MGAAASCIALTVCLASGHGGVLIAVPERSGLALLLDQDALGAPPARGPWYGWETLATDGAALVLVLAGASPRNDVMLTAAAGLYLLGGPAMHWSRRLVGRGFASLGRRALFPVVLGSVFFAVASAGGRPPEGAELGPVVAAIMGGGADALVAIVWDAISRDDPGLDRVEDDPDALRGSVFAGGGFMLFADSTGGGPAASVDATFESTRWLLHASGLKGTTHRYFTSDVSSASLTANRLFWAARATPYLGLGLGYLRESTTFSGQSADVSGPAAVAEAGWLLHRAERWGRILAGVQAVVPLFGAHAPSGFTHSPAFPLFGVSLRLML